MPTRQSPRDRELLIEGVNQTISPALRALIAMAHYQKYLEYPERAAALLDLERAIAAARDTFYERIGV